jgi:hypothetical protein
MISDARKMVSGRRFVCCAVSAQCAVASSNITDTRRPTSTWRAAALPVAPRTRNVNDALAGSLGVSFLWKTMENLMVHQGL